MPTPENVWDAQDGDEFATMPVGIDLGTTNSCIAFWNTEKTRVKTIKMTEEKADTMPSVVRIVADGRSCSVSEVGHVVLAEDGARTTGTVVGNVKRLIGRRFEDADVQEWKQNVSYGIKQGSTSSNDFGSDIEIVGDEMEGVSGVCPEQVAASILGKLKEYGEEYMGTPVENAVITVPAYFTDAQRVATKRAAGSVGLRVLKLLSEPMAAAMSYGLFVAGTKTVAIFDFGGGTLDVSVLSISDGSFKTKAIGGDNMLGGDDFDVLLMHYCLSKSNIQEANLSNLPTRAFRKLVVACERAKRELSSSLEATISYTLDGDEADQLRRNYPGCDVDQGQTEVQISRKKFEELAEPLFERCKSVLRRVMKDAQLGKGAIDEVVLVGGSSKVPAVQELLKGFFHKDELCASVQGNRAVAEGAAIQAAIIAKVDRYHLSKVLLFDATPYSLGLEGSNGEFSVVIPRNTQFPVSVTKRYQTFSDHQPGVSIDVFEGEDPVAHNNNWLGYFDFPIPRGSAFKAGERSIEIVFSITKDGVLAIRSAVPEDEKQLAGGGSDEQGLTPREFATLVMVMGALLLLYLVAKFQFAALGVDGASEGAELVLENSEL